MNEKLEFGCNTLGYASSGSYLPDTIILFSGGADSTLMLKLALSFNLNPLCLLIDYGQKHIAELDKAVELCMKNSVMYTTVSLKDYNVNSGLTGSGDKNLYEGVHSHNVPARNTIFLAIAAGIAESRRVKKVWIGCDSDDYYNEFPDCKQEYIGKMNEVFKIAFSYPIEIEAPLLGMNKANILKMLKKFGVEENEIFSGYGEYS